MTKIKDSVLIKKNEKYYLKDKEYNGIIFFIIKSIITKRKICKKGFIIEDYFNKYIDYSLWNLHINDEFLKCHDSSDGEFIFYYDNKLFTGISYVFDEDGTLTEEVVYRNGFPINSKLGADDSGLVEIAYDENGEIYRLVTNTGDSFQEYRKYDKNHFSYIYFSLFSNKKQILNIELRYEEINKVSKISFSKDFFDYIHIIREKAKMNFSLKKDFLENIKGNEYLSILEAGVDDEIFHYLYLNNGLKNIKSLYIRDSSLTDESFKKLIGLKNLENLNITSYECSLEVVESIKKHNPNCKISLNTKEII